MYPEQFFLLMNFIIDDILQLPVHQTVWTLRQLTRQGKMLSVSFMRRTNLLLPRSMNMTKIRLTPQKVMMVIRNILHAQ